MHACSPKRIIAEIAQLKEDRQKTAKMKIFVAIHHARKIKAKIQKFLEVRQMHFTTRLLKTELRMSRKHQSPMPGRDDHNPAQNPVRPVADKILTFFKAIGEDPDC